MSLEKLFLKLKGSSYSGNYGHAGRKGKRGGSTPGGGHSAILKKAHDLIDSLEDTKEEVYSIHGPEIKSRDIFKGEGKIRIFGFQGSDEKKFLKKEVDLKSLTPGQTSISRAGLHAYIDNPPKEKYGEPYIPQVVKIGNNYHIASGHTRLGAALARGEEKSEVRLYELDPKTDKYKSKKDINL